MGYLSQRIQTSDFLLQAHEEKTQAVYEIIKEIATATSYKRVIKRHYNTPQQYFTGHL